MRQRSRNAHHSMVTMDNWNRPDTEKISRGAALRTVGEVVYVVRIGEVIKIGHTTNLQMRFSSLRADEVLAFRPGTLDDEQAIHASLDGHQHHGHEFYYPTRAVLEVVNDMRVMLGLEPIAA